MVSHEPNLGAVIPECPECSHGGLFVDGIPRQPGQRSELNDHGADGGRASDGGFSHGNAVAEVDLDKIERYIQIEDVLCSI